LITGENGTGKELVARAIHRLSPRAGKAVVEVNCAAIPSELIESELFGHMKGSFTGAFSDRPGKFEQADGGTLFLDEVGDMSLAAQSKVLRALEEGVVTRIGATKPVSVDVRVIAATNKKLSEEIEAGRFREDLYYRLNVVPIAVPPLGARREDVPLLVEKFAADFARESGLRVKRFEEQALEALAAREWPGNVRELRNAVERLIILSSGERVTAADVRRLMGGSAPTELADLSSYETFEEFKESSERAFLKAKLEEKGWNVSETARALSMPRSNLYKKIEKYGLERE
jgi:two-component system nitrogen regulation response regulator NtrX